jgi:hypothetical protein
MIKTFLLVAVGVMLGYAWCYSVPKITACDEITELATGGLVCEVFIRESSVDKVKNTNQVTGEDRI